MYNDGFTALKEDFCLFMRNYFIPFTPYLFSLINNNDSRGRNERHSLSVFPRNFPRSTFRNTLLRPL